MTEPRPKPACPRPYAVAHPQTFELDTRAQDVRPGAVLLAQSPFYPGGGGQLPDRGTIACNGRTFDVVGFEPTPQGMWHLIDDEVAPSGLVDIRIDANSGPVPMIVCYHDEP